ncbi:MAG: hypothetical protein K6E51_00545 [Treponema sp.]|nr:hypothetical protein [Treponema sp.]
MHITKKNTVITLCILAVLSVIVALVLDFLINPVFGSELKVQILFGLCLTLPGFIILLGINKIMRLFGIAKKSVKPFVFIAAILFIALLIVFGFLNGNATQRFRYKLSDIIYVCYMLCFSCLFLLLFLIDVDETKIVIAFDDFVLQNRKTDKANKDNLPVTIKKLCKPEVYFENGDYERIYNKHAAFILKTAEEHAKQILFDNDLQYETTGEWYLSRIDFLRGEGFSPKELHYCMTFIKSKTTSYRLYGLVELTKKTVESDYCRVDCIFNYDSSQEEQPFTFQDSEVEFL